MSDSDIDDGIRNYNRHVEDADYVRALLAPAGAAGLAEAAREMVRGGRPDDVAAATLVALDLGRSYFMPDETTEAFRAATLATGLLGAIGDTLRAGVYVNRANAINTLGRLGFPEAVPMLTGAAERYFELDPLLLPVLLRELFWLTRRHDWRQVGRAASHPNYLFRWSALPFLEPPYPDAGTTHYESKKRLATALSEDASPLVRAEARYCLERMTLKEAGSGLTKAESRKRYRALRRQFEPDQSFAGLGIAFWARREAPDYSTAELDAFARALAGASE